MYYFIVNPGAGRGRGEKIWKKLESRLQHTGLEYEVSVTEKTGDAARITAGLTERGAESRTIVAVGGDGTLNEVINGLSFRGPVTLGYIPAGIGSNLARSLKLPKDPARGLKRILEGKIVKQLDYGILSYECGQPVHRRFLISCGIGLDAQVCQRMLAAQESQGRWPRLPGRLDFILKGIVQTLCARPVKGYLVLDGSRKIEFNHIYFISAHIQPFEGAGLKLAPAADGSDGFLEICVVHNSVRRQLLPIMADALFGRIGRHRGVRFYQCQELQVHMESPVCVHTDGENCYSQKDIHLRCIGRKVRLVM
ncbi:MAG: diacylglycerol kinase family lipid kinase [Lachnospiraceae bacterium]|jgi:YegS/Rv2252/BmrU family lipid kinase|nr:diacylglycerol kinase family lipid kinase [Lachnospiraceae bacterium]